MIPGQREGVRILQIFFSMSVLLESSLSSPPLLTPGRDSGGTTPVLCSVEFSGLILHSCINQIENIGNMLRVGKEGEWRAVNCYSKVEEVTYAVITGNSAPYLTSEGTEKDVGILCSIYVVQSPLISSLTELLAYARHWARQHVYMWW